MHMPTLSGVYTAIVTPFLDDSSVDYPSFERLVEEQCAAGIHGIVISGSTGEGATLEDDDRLELLRRALAVAKGRTKIIAGAGHNITKRAVALQQAVQQLPIAATLQVTPWYNKPTPEGLYRHFRAIADIATVPIILYNVPSRTALDMDVATVLRVAKDCPRVMGIKDSNTNLGRLQSMIAGLKATRPDFVVLSGEDDATLALMALGGHGVISVVSNFAPKETVQLFNAYTQGDIAGAQQLAYRINELAKLMFFRSNPIPVKSALALQGKLKHNFRAPLCELNETDLAYLATELKKQGWL